MSAHMFIHVSIPCVRTCLEQGVYMGMHMSVPVFIHMSIHMCIKMGMGMCVDMSTHMCAKNGHRHVYRHVSTQGHVWRHGRVP